MSDWPHDWDDDGDPWEELPEINMDPDLLFRIGLFTVSWARLEAQFDTLFPILYKLDPTYALTITAGLGLKARIAMLRSATYQIQTLLGEPTASNLLGILEDVAYFSVEWRNNLAHANYEDGDAFIKISNHKELKGRFLEASIEDFDSIINDITELSNEIHQMIPVLIRIMRDVTAADFDRVCAFSG